MWVQILPAAFGHSNMLPKRKGAASVNIEVFGLGYHTCKELLSFWYVACSLKGGQETELLLN